MKIGIDVDDTITETYETMFAYAQEFNCSVLNRECSYQPFYDLPCHKTLAFVHNWSKEELTKYYDMYYDKILENVKGKTLSKEYINKLKAENNEIIIITARPDTDKVDAFDVTKRWLERNGIEYDKIITNAEEKGSIAKENNIDIFIDDSMENCVDVSNYGIKSYIMDSRTNSKNYDERVKRIYSWPQFYQEIKKEA